MGCVPYDERNAVDAILADEFVEYFDGFSVGSIDLTQRILGLDCDSGPMAALVDERDEAIKVLRDLAISKC